MFEVDAEEVSTLRKEVEGKLLNISFIYHKKQNSIERVLPDELWYLVIEEHSEYEWQNDIDGNYSRQFIEEEIEIIGEESSSFWIFTQEFWWCVVVFLVNCRKEVAVCSVNSIARGCVIAVFE